MLKICSPQLGLSPHSSLGGEIYDYQIIKGFTKYGFKVYTLLPKEKEFDKTLKNLKVKVFPIKHIVPPWIYSFLMLPYLFNLYKKEKFDILRIHSPSFLGLGAIIFHCFYPNVPIITSAVTVDSPGIFYLIEKWIYQNSKLVIVQSEYMKKFISKKYKLKQKNILVSYGGQVKNLKKWKTKPNQAKLINPNDKVLIFMGALIKRKNPQFVLTVFKKVKEKIPNSKLIFIGQGDQKKKLLTIIKIYNLEEDVIFIDYSYGEQKAFWFSIMDIFLFPSLNEGFGLVVTEAMSFQKVVITSNKAAFPEIIDSGKNGYCLNLNEKKWTATIIKILTNRGLQRRLEMKAAEKVKNDFNWERTYRINAQAVANII